MKGVNKKCYGLLLALFVIFGLSLNVSSGVNATRHNVRSIPFAVPYDYNSSTTSLLGDFQLVYNIHNSGDDIDYDPVTAWAFRSTSNSDHCYYQSDYNAMNNNGITISYHMPYFLDYASYGTSLSSQGLSYECNRLQALPSNYDWSSVPPYVFGRPDLRSLNPYWFEYSGAYGFDSMTDDGLNYGVKLSLEDIFGVAPNRFKEIQIPLGLTTDSFGEVYRGRQIEVAGEWMFDSANPDVDVLSLANPTSTYFYLYYTGYTSRSNWESGSYISGFIECSYDVKRNSNSAEFPYILSYSCPFISEYDFMTGYLGFTIRMWTASGDYLWDYPAITWLFESSFLVTDGDDTVGSDFGISVIGGNSDGAPGSATGASSSDANWFASLTNLFTFNFINPFAPLFSLFLDGNSCAQIPILAGMLHSSESQVCPWFSSSVRNILTPVFGISSVMLIFGFAVRWLGSSSGNLFEDSSIEEISNVNHAGWRRYKK